LIKGTTAVDCFDGAPRKRKNGMPSAKQFLSGKKKHVFAHTEKAQRRPQTLKHPQTFKPRASVWVSNLHTAAHAARESASQASTSFV